MTRQEFNNYWIDVIQFTTLDHPGPCVEWWSVLSMVYFLQGKKMS